MSDLTTLLGAEGGGVLGIPTYELIIGLVAFFIVFGALAKFALPKVKVILDEREEAIAGGIRKAEQAQQESAQLKEELSTELAAARQQAAEIRTQAQADRAAIIEEARQEAITAARSVTEQAQVAIEADKFKAISELRGSVGTMAADLAGRIVGESMTDDDRAKRVIDRFIEDLDSSTAGQA